MRNVEELLNEIFHYKRDEHPLYKKLVEAGSTTGVPGFSNVRVESLRFGIYGVIPQWTFDNRGNMMAYYSAEKNWENEGPQLSHPRLGAFRDNAHTYHGVLINCLALMSGKNWHSLMLVKLPLDGESKYYQLKSYRPDIAQLFLSVLTGIEPEPVEAASVQSRQFALFGQ